jgi:tRNA nucleotidyltransferase/poly(A) polymerase
MSLYIPKELEEISKELNSKGKRAILVGGSVRDYFLGFSIKETGNMCILVCLCCVELA